ncbi:phosphate ABC transporter substrate-binding protein PstS [Undibacterium sp. RTI2.1]|uniref:phosphate ABC transporter substrate-binding protein PstS n=1 Tax=unclassified Undibacterium TaxID=2630295 RepID=UPI002AB558AC|nr:MULTISPECIES: phosphate ABC transporter substrate-binding protein PstS [unclassified Undibacterium]MDY7537048.1 phosphate ABC transporter substrate-binding protein PstS [Undibacterium sp. 5I1]MEB0030415.1 phosphate ABC transporter substrate-binding protein PstS [Undibacterium sp. RTI2.1]MEB0115198.1 phosphate ABC transporter substrate-binding protein PstS [Undibacterium sp. RTI2.2]MEB0229226.1 phosphate ABC transporter substrate-binding protein PstS [Undibacterium sp. 10I3]MEB0256226.1 phos
MQLNRIVKSLVVTLAAVGATVSLSAAYAADMTGAGATFPYPIYAKWAEAYKKATGNGLNYQSIGSGGGIKQIKAKTVDFGASDMPLKLEELEADGLTQFPAIIGGVVPVVNLDGVGPGKMKMTGDVLAGIYMGKITKWNAPEIVALNPGIKLPAEDINVVHRSDGSGTTFLWSDYLSKVNAEFKTVVGASTAVKWPVGLGGKGNEGVAANVQRIKNSIGYVEYAYVKRNKMTYTLLKNADGQFAEPDDENFKAAAAGADWAKAPGMYLVLTNQPGKVTWPITGASFIIMYKSQVEADKGKEVLKFFDWAFKNGGAMATELEYVSLPAPVVKLIEDSWKSKIKDASGKAIW